MYYRWLPEGVEMNALGAQLAKQPEGNHVYALDTQVASLLIEICLQEL